MEALVDRLRRKLREAFSQTWDHANAMDAVLDAETGLDPSSGRLSGGVSFRIRDGKGAWHVVHHEPIDAVGDAVALDDAVAQGISLFLMKHPTWPR